MSQNALKLSKKKGPLQAPWFLDLLGLDQPPQEGQEVTCRSQKLVMKDNILRVRETFSSQQEQTSNIFGFKWKKQDTFEGEGVTQGNRAWLMERYGDFGDLDFSGSGGKKITVLDAGCGASLSAFLYFEPYFDTIYYIGTDISESVDVALDRSLSVSMDCAYLQSDLNNLPLAEKSVDVVFSEGVLHHTDNTEEAFSKVANLVKEGGYIMFYVYRKKGPIREFTDDYIRTKIQEMPPQEAWDAIMPLTKLGKVLGELDVEIDVPEDIDLLGVSAGKINLQRFVYWHVMKAFYRPEMTLEEMNHTNFDWYAPKNAHRHTLEEVRGWCKNAGFIIQKEKEEEAGISVIAKRL